MQGFSVSSKPLRIPGLNLQSPIASVQRTQSTLASHSAVPRGTNTTPTNANRTIRIATQRTQGLRGPSSFFRGRYDRQRTLVIRNWKATKEYLNQRGTKIRVFRVCFRTPFLPPFFAYFSPLFPLQALCILAPLLPSSPPPSSPLFLAPGKVRFRYPSDLGTL